MVRQFSSTAVETTLAAGASPSDTTITVASTSGYPVATPYTLSIDAENASKELVEVTGVAGTTLTVTRGIDGTAAVSHSLGAVVRHDHSARDFREAAEHMAASADVHGVSGDLVGETTAQVLTNKDLSDPSNTFPSSLATDVEVAAAAATAAADLAAHTGDATDAHDASAISFSPTGSIAATDVQAAVAEVASDYATADGLLIPKSLVDAKGDLIVASAADTPARLAAGANGALLVPDSAQATGLKYTTTLFLEGTGSPEGVAAAPIGSSYRDTDASSGFLWWVKASGVGNTGWRPAGVASQPLVYLKATAGTVLAATYRKINLDETVHLDADYFSVASSVVTITEDGFYDLSGQVGIVGGSSDRFVGITRNGIAEFLSLEGVTVSANESNFFATTTLHYRELSAGDQIQLSAVSASGNTTSHNSGSYYSYLCIRKVG